MDSDSDDEFIPHPGTVARITGNILHLDNLRGSLLAIFQDLDLALQDLLWYRADIIKDIKQLQHNRGDDEDTDDAVVMASSSTAPYALVVYNTEIGKLRAKKELVSEDIASIVMRMESVRTSVLNLIHERTCLQVELALANERF